LNTIDQNAPEDLAMSAKKKFPWKPELASPPGGMTAETAVAIEEPVDSADPVDSGDSADSVSDLSDEEIDRIIEAANPPAPATLPKPPSAWMAWDPKGQGEAVRVEYRGDGRLEVTLGIVKLGVRLADLDTSAGQIREQTAAEVRELPSVPRWQATLLELAGRERDLRLAKAQIEKLAAERNILLDEGTGGSLAQRLRDLDEQTQQARCRAELAQDDVRLLTEAAKRQKQAASADVEATYASALIAAAATGKQKVEALVAEFLAKMTTLLDEVARTKMTRDSVGRLAGMDRRPLVNQILLTLAAEVQVRRPAIPVPPSRGTCG
jgi:hypothetical protein